MSFEPSFARLITDSDGMVCLGDQIGAKMKLVQQVDGTWHELIKEPWTDEPWSQELSLKSPGPFAAWPQLVFENKASLQLFLSTTGGTALNNAVERVRTFQSQAMALTLDEIIEQLGPLTPPATHMTTDPFKKLLAIVHSNLVTADMDISTIPTFQNTAGKLFHGLGDPGDDAYQAVDEMAELLERTEYSRRENFLRGNLIESRLNLGNVISVQPDLIPEIYPSRRFLFMLLEDSEPVGEVITASPWSNNADETMFVTSSRWVGERRACQALVLPVRQFQRAPAAVRPLRELLNRSCPMDVHIGALEDDAHLPIEHV